MHVWRLRLAIGLGGEQKRQNKYENGQNGTGNASAEENSHDISNTELR